MKNEPKLELLCEYYATLKEPVVVGNGPYGMRQIFDITGGEVTGSRLRGRILPSGADWILIGAEESAASTYGEPSRPTTVPSSTSRTPASCT